MKQAQTLANGYIVAVEAQPAAGRMAVTIKAGIIPFSLVLSAHEASLLHDLLGRAIAVAAGPAQAGESLVFPEVPAA